MSIPGGAPPTPASIDFLIRGPLAVRRIAEEALKQRDINIHSVQSRAKEPKSLGDKAATPSDTDPKQPKYTEPLKQITDLAGVRVIAYFPGTLEEIDEILSAQFTIVERSDKGEALIEEERLGYQSIHYLVKLTTARARLPEYARFANAITEIQVRTILQHAWAEIEHDIQYKSASVIPREIRRRFMSLAGVLEIADREFQAIQDADAKLRAEARTSVEKGTLGSVEITPDSVKAFLDQKLGPDGRISEFSYNWTARLLIKLGFRTLKQVEECIRGYNDDALSRIVYESRQGQTTRFEYMLLAGMGETYIQRHSYQGFDWFPRNSSAMLAKLRDAGVEIRNYDPASPPPEPAPVSTGIMAPTASVVPIAAEPAPMQPTPARPPLPPDPFGDEDDAA